MKYQIQNSFFFVLLQDWFAFLGDELNFTIAEEKLFPNKGNPSAEDNYGFCEVSTAFSDKDMHASRELYSIIKQTGYELRDLITLALPS